MDDCPYICAGARKVRQPRHLSQASLYCSVYGGGGGTEEGGGGGGGGGGERGQGGIGVGGDEGSSSRGGGRGKCTLTGSYAPTPICSARRSLNVKALTESPG
uniref:Uncharacterized protein n=1 Tax=Vespula pensylvanica TaxID=30213 RepID=A0A834KTR9_VESPE|nr:hypothetical protein H0235_012679 [Vespula pensylvanica]